MQMRNNDFNKFHPERVAWQMVIAGPVSMQKQY